MKGRYLWLMNLAEFLNQAYEGVDGYIRVLCKRIDSDGQIKVKEQPRFFSLDRCANIVKYVEENKHQWDICVNLATMDGSGGKKENVISIPFAWCDIDFNGYDRTVGIPQEEADQLLTEFELEPTFTVFTGNGYQCWWRLEEPLGKDGILIVQDINARLALRLKGDVGAKDAVHLMRMPFTYNHKYSGHKLDVKVVRSNPRTYHIADFDILPKPRQPEKRTSSSTPGGTFREFEGTTQGNRNTALFTYGSSLRARGADNSRVNDLLKEANLRCAPPLNDAELITIINQVCNYPQKGKEICETPRKSISSPQPEERRLFNFAGNIIDGPSFYTLEFPPRKVYMSPWLMENSLSLLSAKAGVGKSMFALGITKALSEGTSFGPWSCEAGWIPCLYLDGEMDLRDLRDRFQKMGIDTQRNIKISSSTYNCARGEPANKLFDRDWQKEVQEYLCKEEIKLWVVDNIASLNDGTNENTTENWAPVNSWLLELKGLGISTILIHHEGKNGDQRGASHRIDNLDTHISLKLPSDYKPEDGCRFICRFEKKRVDQRALSLVANTEFRLSLNENGLYQWTWGSEKKDMRDQILELLRQDTALTDKQIAEAVGCDRSYVTKTRSSFKKRVPPRE